jgi:uncharacterized protein (DUF305 family)
MQTKPLLYGIIGFILGGLLVSIAATTFEKPQDDTMDDMVSALQDKQGDAFDKAFVADMITHHQQAIDMARLAENQAKHNEIKELSEAIIDTQQQEIDDMRQWQAAWGYPTDAPNHQGM